MLDGPLAGAFSQGFSPKQFCLELSWGSGLVVVETVDDKTVSGSRLPSSGGVLQFAGVEGEVQVRVGCRRPSFDVRLRWFRFRFLSRPCQVLSCKVCGEGVAQASTAC